jgi:hypothetical protein
MILWQTYTVHCSLTFRQSILDLAEQQAVSVSDLARAALLVLPAEVVDRQLDPGGPAEDDRIGVPVRVIDESDTGEPELPLLQSPWLEVEARAGLAIEHLRRALALVLDMNSGLMTVGLADEAGQLTAPRPIVRERRAFTGRRRKDLERDEFAEENARLRATIAVLAFDLLPFGVSSREDALYVLGFPPHAKPTHDEIKARFRLLATVHHPDSGFGTHDRMSQLNAATTLLRR